MMASEGVGVPSDKEIEALPLLARVAFAARCARRVFPLFRRYWPNAPEVHVRAVERAVTSAERVAADADALAYSFADVARATARDANDAADAADENDFADAYAYAAARAATFAAAAAAYSVEATARATANVRATAAAAASSAAAAAARAAARAATIDGIRIDFHILRRAASEYLWTDHTPVPPSSFPPLLDHITADAANGDETISPLTEDSDPAPPLSLLIEVGTLTPYEIQEVISLLGEMYNGLTGDELIIDSTDTFEPVASLVPQGGLS